MFGFREAGDYRAEAFINWPQLMWAQPRVWLRSYFSFFKNFRISCTAAVNSPRLMSLTGITSIRFRLIRRKKIIAGKRQGPWRDLPAARSTAGHSLFLLWIWRACSKMWGLRPNHRPEFLNFHLKNSSIAFYFLPRPSVRHWIFEYFNTFLETLVGPLAGKISTRVKKADRLAPEEICGVEMGQSPKFW
jgi:hypothetical protein